MLEALELRVLGQKDGASFQVIVLGSSGGPREDNVTGLLVRTPQTEWGKSSMIAVDAGSHLANIIRILERHMPISSEDLPPKGYSRILEEGPFAGIRFPHISAKANGLHIFREILHAFLITHPHIDHLSGMAINTPALEYGREAKAIVALPSTIDAIKNHIFNDWLWPNLSDEGNGVGFVTYRRLIEGGNVRLGSGEARGYVNVCDGLATKCWGISHGKCHFRRRQSSSHQHNDSFGWGASDYNFPSRRMSRISDSEYLAALTQQTQVAGGYSQGTPQMSMGGAPMTPAVSNLPGTMLDPNHMFEPVSSSAFFIRNDTTGNEILIFGDVEPDSVSMSPRNHTVWDDAAGKIVSGVLKAIFIECSYDDSVRNEDLYGHLCPRHLIAELSFLAKCVINKSKQHSDQDFNGVGARFGEPEFAVPDMSMRQPPTPGDLKKKRKRALNGDLATTPELGPTNFDSVPSPQPPLPGSYVGTRVGSSTRRKVSREANNLAQPSPTFGRGRSVQFQPGSGSPSLVASAPPHAGTAANHSHSQSMSSQRERFPEPLKGVAVHVIHVKDTLMDGPSPGDIILGQLRAQGEDAGLGVSFDVTHHGDSIWL
ncbi:3',5'-cyclic-nucleotide phosphodiesterase [Exophiala viscosa]|uniref:3',5'-cyclic-nucleotide phosphodiesterase n=1 Tax=Exophiala viscosa TaxID=2486360 RepID=A0AAN6DNN4_9EURO|nr:3',5'-cyclic-nucleotide phosphodiesterase [Exophiala viscosa]